MKIVYTSAPKEEAKRIGKLLIEERLAACVGFFALESFYWWKGKIEESNETGMIIKTKDQLADEVMARIKALHSYEIPCIICLDFEKGNQEYLDWIKKEVKRGEKNV